MSTVNVAPTALPAPDPPDQERCVDAIDALVRAERGIVGAQLDPGRGELSFSYDPVAISSEHVAAIAERVAPTVEQRWRDCVMLLEGAQGRACEGCAQKLEERLNRLAGVRRVSASYAGGALALSYDDGVTSPSSIAEYVRPMGAVVKPLAQDEAAPPDTALASIRAWLTTERLEVLGVIVSFVGMIGGGIAEAMGRQALSDALFLASYIGGGAFGLKASLVALRHRTVEIDLLMILAALGAASIGAAFEGAMLLFLFSLSNVLQAYAIGRSRSAIQALMKLRPHEALARRGTRTIVVPIEQLAVGDRIIVRPGERIPMDGVVVEGESAVDQATVTGESMPVTKHVGDKVFASTINQSGGLEVQVTQLAADSTIARLIKMVEEAQSQQAPTQRFLNKFEQYYAMGVIAFTGLLIVVPPVLTGMSFDAAFYRAMTVMVGASPCALVISTPASILSAIANGARRGVLFKGGAYLEQAANIKVVCFDKTGTLTEGKPTVTDVKIIPLFVAENVPVDAARHEAERGPEAGHALPRSNEDILLMLAAAVEAKSEHPLGLAIVGAARRRELNLPEVSHFQATAGRGVGGRVAFMGGLDLRIGSPPLFDGMNVSGMDAALGRMGELQDEGKTSVIVAKIVDERHAHVLGVIAIADVLRDDAAEAIRRLKAAGVERVVMITGDNRRVAQAIAKQAGVDEFYADLLPEDKVRIVREQERYGPVAMVGDGVNDAPALASATIGVAMGAAGTDVALETADMVLMSNDLTRIPYAIALSKKSRRVVLQNLTFAGAIIVVLVISALGFALPLPIAVIGHEGSTVLVCLNGLRLLRFKG